MVTLTNTGPTTCHLTGFPNIVLDDADNGAQQWPINKGTGQTPKTVTIAPGNAAYVRITYLSYDGPDSGTKFPVGVIDLTPPNNTKSMSIGINQGQTWNVTDQSGATHPGTFTSPIVSTSLS